MAACHAALDPDEFVGSAGADGGVDEGTVDSGVDEGTVDSGVDVSMDTGAPDEGFMTAGTPGACCRINADCMELTPGNGGPTIQQRCVEFNGVSACIPNPPPTGCLINADCRPGRTCNTDLDRTVSTCADAPPLMQMPGMCQ